MKSADEKPSGYTPTQCQQNPTHCWIQNFSYDRFGNRTFDTNNTTTLNQAVSWKVTNPQITTADNRLKKDQDNDNVNDYDFDREGNLTLDAENRRYIYDAENHLKEFFKGTNNTNMPDGKYLYDGEGRRVKKISSTETTVFIYDGGGQLAAEYSTAAVAAPTTSYLTTDHLGSPRIITDQNGNIIARKDYSAFGGETAATGQRTPALGYKPENIRQDYTGYQKDDESNLEYAQARYYNSSHGRFTSVDPLTASANVKDPQTFNRYSYVLNSPYKFSDPLGLLASEPYGACGTWCPGKGDWVDGSAFRGTDTSFADMFNAMALGRQVSQALATLASGDWTPGSGVNEEGRGEKTKIRIALKDILENGTTLAKTIASALINSYITINVLPQSEIGASANTDISSVWNLNIDLKTGMEITKNDALGYLVINIAREELGTASQIQGNLIHEGSHALAIADTISSISLKGSYDKPQKDDEMDAKLADVNYKIHRGGDFLKHGQSLNYIDSLGKPNMPVLQSAANQYTGTIRGFLRGRKVNW